MTTPEQKIRQAKQLMVQATQQIRRQKHAKRDALKCGCTHRFDQHTVSHSINYTGGFCMVDGCKCLNFMSVR